LLAGRVHEAVAAAIAAQLDVRMSARMHVDHLCKRWLKGC
jgi:hypothetical protein